MTFAVDVQLQGDYALDPARLQTAASTVLAQQNALPGSGLTIVIAGDEFVAALNRQYRGIDAPTDVLSFPADEPPGVEDGEPPYLGDLIIAYPYASAQAALHGHPLDDSLALLVAHGTLHLLGYDHDTPDTRALMWAAQASALRALNVPLHIVPALEEADFGESH
jgi:probable rRNA maturation factor